MLKCLRGLGFGLVALVSIDSAAAADDQLEKGIDRAVRRQGVTADGPGIAIVVMQPGHEAFQKTYGLADLKTRSPITPRTMFELASLSKPFTATAILLLHDRGKLSIDDDVRTVVPEVPVYPGGTIRIRDLLHHTSGLPEYLDWDDVPARHRTYWDNDDYIGELARRRKALPLDFPTGRRYEYCNTNYLLLATIVARVGKKSYGTFLRDEVFLPLGMKHTFVYESPESARVPPPRGYERATGYELGKNDNWRAAWGAPPSRTEGSLSVGDGGVWSNLEDMVAWDAAQRAGKLLSPATRAAALRPSSTSNGKRNSYGLGWQLEIEEGELIGYGHNGLWGGFRTEYYLDLENERTTIVLANNGELDSDDVWDVLNEVFEKHWDE